MLSKDWENIVRSWKEEKKPDVGLDTLRADAKKREILRKFRVFTEVIIVTAVIVLTVHSFIVDASKSHYIVITQLWLITIIALSFNYWNRLSLKHEVFSSQSEYLKLFLNHSRQKRNTAYFVFFLTSLNLIFYVILFVSGHILYTDTGVLTIIALAVIIYYGWSFWYYKRAINDVNFYRQKLLEISDQ